MNDATKGAITLSVVFALGLGTGWMLWRPKPTKPETYAPAVRQSDGSEVLERKPMTPTEAEKIVPTPQLPKGAKLERKVQVVVQPNAPALPPVLPSGVSVPVEPAKPCPPVRVDLALVKMPDDSRRVIATSPDGKVVGGVDIPIEAPKPVKALKWAAGLEWSANQWSNTKSIVVQRDIGFLRVGGRMGKVTLTMPSGGVFSGGEAAVSVMVRF